MDDLSVKNRHNAAAAVAGNAKAGKTQAATGPQFSSFLMFGTDNLNNNMSMSADSGANDGVYDDGGSSAYNHDYRDDREPVSTRQRDDEPRDTARDDRDYSRDDEPRQHASDDHGAHDQHAQRDDYRQDDAAPRERQASNDDGTTDTTSQDHSQNEGGAQNNASDQSGQESAQQATGDNVSDQAASNAFAQGAQAAAQMATDPAIIAMADPKKGPMVSQAALKTNQNVQGIDLNASSNKDLFSSGWGSGAQNTNAATQGATQGQGQQQAQNAQANAQNMNPQLQAALNGNAQTQASDLAKKIGANQRAKVNVNVTNQNADVTGLSTQDLSNAAQVATQATDAQGAAKKQTGPQMGQQNANANAQNALANAQAQVNQQNNQNTQNQNFQTMVGDAKGAGAAAKTAQASLPQGVNADMAQVNTQNNTQQTQQAQQAAQTKQAAQQKPTVHTSAKPEEISVEISKAAKAGHDRIAIQLKPAEMGRIEVQLDFSTGKVVASIVAERPETLQMLKNDSSNLEKALTEAGLKMGDMNFDLQKQNEQGQEMAGSGNGSGSGDTDNGLSEEDEEMLLASEAEMLAQRAQARASLGGIDVSA
jgi:flagellar hook-length control protein FliK